MSLPRRATSPRAPVSSFVVTGPAEWVVVGTSAEGFEAVDALPELVSLGFSLRSDDGRSIAVPEGCEVRVGGGVDARRRGVDRRDDDGIVRTHFTYEIRSGTPVHVEASWTLDGTSPYRGGPRRVRGAHWIHVAGSPEALRDPRLMRRSGVTGAIVFGMTFVIIVATTLAGTVLR